MRRAARTLVLLLSLAVCALGQAAEDARRADLRERWGGKSDEERALLLRRFEELRALPPAEAELLRERARRLRAEADRLAAEAPAGERAALADLPPAERRRHWCDRALERSRERGRLLREELPPWVREQLEAATPEERRAFFHRLRLRERGPSVGRAIVRLGTRLDLPPAEIEALLELPQEERVEAMLSLRRRAFEEELSREGPPPWIDGEQWRRMRELGDDEFLRRLFGRPPPRHEDPRGRPPRMRPPPRERRPPAEADAPPPQRAESGQGGRP